ncbi:MAG: hypothetical protein HZB55_21045 [Deltaproteobacteria bacterium]|nr:hypothetical protein [Deltaproteobacteria bacterium]
MSEFEFRLAGDEDDEDLRRLMVENPVPGRVTLSYEREPDYFAGCGPLGSFWQVLLVRHRSTGTLAGVGCRASRPLFVNGRVEEVGYLGHLRVDRRFRGRWLVPRAFRELRALHEDRPVAGYVTTIVEDNAEALGVLVDRARGPIPGYRPVGLLHTLALAAKPPRSGSRGPCEVRWGHDVALADVTSFLAESGGRRQFFPLFREEDFAPGSPVTRGFRLEDLAVALRGREVAGVLGLWDQSGYKQTVVRGYGTALRWARPLVNAVSGPLGYPRLPPVGSPLRAGFGSFRCVDGDDPAVWRVLLAHVLGRARDRGLSYVMVGLMEGDPLLSTTRSLPHVEYRSRLYTVSWDDGGFHARLDGRAAHVEIAAL